MLPRTTGMWWGAAIDAPDPAALAAFYAALMGWPIVHQEPGTSVLGASEDGSTFVVFQQADDYERPVWPPEPGRQRPMMHLDVQVADLDVAVDVAIAAGAVLAEHQPQPSIRVLLDPAGHPFCVCLDEV